VSLLLDVSLPEQTVPAGSSEASWEPAAPACNSSYLGGRNQEDHGSKPGWGGGGNTLIQKYPTRKEAGGVAQVIAERLPSKHNILSSNSNPSAEKRKESPETSSSLLTAFLAQCGSAHRVQNCRKSRARHLHL
jgi:hypothetical protein